MTSRRALDYLRSRSCGRLTANWISISRPARGGRGTQRAYYLILVAHRWRGRSPAHSGKRGLVKKRGGGISPKIKDFLARQKNCQTRDSLSDNLSGRILTHFLGSVRLRFGYDRRAIRQALLLPVRLRFHGGFMMQFVSVRKIRLAVLAGLVAVSLLARAVPSLAQEALSPRPISQALTFQPAVTVVDSKGQEVGPFFYPEFALTLVNGSSVLFQVDKTGFVGTGVTLYYSTKNCTGTAYVQTGTNPTPNALVSLFSPPSFSAGIAGGVVYYPTPGVSKTVTMLSGQGIDGPTGKSDGCRLFSKIEIWPCPNCRPVATFKLSTLGFVPPFKLSW